MRRIGPGLIALLVLAGCAGDGESAGPADPDLGEGSTPSPAAADQTTPTRAADREVLLVASGEQFDRLALLDVDSGELEPVDAPPEVEDTTPVQAIVGANADQVLVVTPDSMYVWDRRADAATFVGYDGRVRGVAPPLRPAAALVETNAGLYLVNLLSGGLRDVTGVSDPGLVARIDVDETGSVAVVGDPSGGGTAVDLATGATEEHDPELLLYASPLSPQGTTLIAGRSSEHGLAVEALPVFDALSSEVWYTPDSPESQVAVAWVGGEVLAVDFAGRVMTITGGEVTELGRLREPDDPDGASVAGAFIRTDPISRANPVAVVEEQGSGPSRWFRVDVAAALVEELPAIAGHKIVVTALAGHLIVGVGTVSDGFSSLKIVRLADGSVVDLVNDPAAPRRHVRAVSDSVLGLVKLDADPIVTELYDPDGRFRAAVTGRLAFVADLAVNRAALSFPNEVPETDGPVTHIVTLDGSRPDVEVPGVVALAWLPPS